MNKQYEALKMAIKFIEAYIEQTEVYEPDASYVLMNCLEALEQPAQSACEECMGFNKQLADENDSLKSRIAELQRYAEAMVNRPTNPAPSWQSLSDDNILKLFKPKFECEIEDFELIDFARAIEQALKEKND